MALALCMCMYVYMRICHTSKNHKVKTETVILIKFQKLLSFLVVFIKSELLSMAGDQAAAKERRILVAVDEGEESMNALSWCLKNVISHNSKDTLILLYVKPPRTVYTALDGTGYLFSSDIAAAIDRYSNEVADCVLEKAKKICREQLDDVKMETRVECGDPRDMICQVAEKLCVDVLVMGSHGYGLIKRALLGSVSNHCAQNVKCPVLIVKRPKSSSCGTK